MTINKATDVDIDFADRQDILNLLEHVPACIKDKGRTRKHNTGVYFHSMPSDPLTGLSTIDHKQAEEMGYFKIDCLNVSLYKDVRDEQHLLELMEKEPQWELLEHDDFTNLLFHVNGHGDILRKLRPQSVEQLAAVLAIIRPAKRHLVNETWQTINENVWSKPEDGGYYFKHSHAIGYAMAVVVHMNLLCESV